jgi:hypothetical protein
LVESDNLRRQQQHEQNNQTNESKLKKDDVILVEKLARPATGLEVVKSTDVNTVQKTRSKRGKRTNIQRDSKQQYQKQLLLLNKPKRSRRRSTLSSNQATESSIASSSSSSLVNQSTRSSNNQSNIISSYINDLFNNKTKQQIEQIFSINALFHSPSSLLTKLDLKSLFQPALFESLPRQSQLKLIKLLPECDRQLDSHGSFK